MKFTLCIAALVSVAMAASIPNRQESVKRQADVQNQVSASVPAMSDQNGNVVAFDANNVYLDMAAKGL